MHGVLCAVGLRHGRVVFQTTLCLIEDPDDQEILLATWFPDRTAVVVTVTSPWRRQRFGDRIAPQHPEPGDGLGEVAEPGAPAALAYLDGARNARGLRRFRSAALLEAGRYRTDRLVAPHPGVRALLRLERQVAERAWGVTAQPLRTNPDLVELWLATPADQSAVELDALLGAATDHWPFPPAYPQLVERSSGDVQTHYRRTEQYAGWGGGTRRAPASAVVASAAPPLG
jgi:hypothetical protein